MRLRLSDAILIVVSRSKAPQLRLADVGAGTTARFIDAQLEGSARALLRALGLTDGSVLRVCQQGEPCVIQVRTTRIGLSGGVARNVFIVPLGEVPPDGGSIA